jgi:hypothetical protein
MFFYIAHYLSLLVTYIQSSCCSVSRRSQVCIYIALFIRRVYIADTLVENDSSLSAHQLQHED